MILGMLIMYFWHAEYCRILQIHYSVTGDFYQKLTRLGMEWRNFGLDLWGHMTAKDHIKFMIHDHLPLRVPRKKCAEFRIFPNDLFVFWVYQHIQRPTVTLGHFLPSFQCSQGCTATVQVAWDPPGGSPLVRDPPDQDSVTRRRAPCSAEAPAHG